MNATIHYSLECFEGLKAYISQDSKRVLMFRPEKNFERMNNSHINLGFPLFDPEEMV